MWSSLFKVSLAVVCIIHVLPATDAAYLRMDIVDSDKCIDGGWYFDTNAVGAVSNRANHELPEGFSLIFVLLDQQIGEDKMNELKANLEGLKKRLVLLTPYGENEEGKMSFFNEKNQLKAQKKLMYLHDRAYKAELPPIMVIFTDKTVNSRYISATVDPLIANVLNDEAKSLCVSPLDPTRFDSSPDAPENKEAPTTQKDDAHVLIHIQIEDADEKKSKKGIWYVKPKKAKTTMERLEREISAGFSLLVVLLDGSAEQIENAKMTELRDALSGNKVRVVFFTAYDNEGESKSFANKQHGLRCAKKLKNLLTVAKVDISVAIYMPTDKPLDRTLVVETPDKVQPFANILNGESKSLRVLSADKIKGHDDRDNGDGSAQ